MEALEPIDVVIVGAGPIGLTTSLLLGGFGVDHWIVEQRSAPGDHPQAHFISTRSMEIFGEIPGLAAAIRDRTPPLAQWRRYVYCTDIYHLPESETDADAASGSLLAARDHFPQGPDKATSPAWESHLPQHQLVDLLRETAAQHPRCRLLEGHRAEVHDRSEGVSVNLTRGDGRETQTLRCRYAILADGAHGAGRESVGIGRENVGISRGGRSDQGQSLISVHFFSQALAGLIHRRITGMLYFLYTPAGVGTLVNHGLEQGEFVLQLPIFPPHQDAAGFTKPVCVQLIDRLVGSPVQAEIRSIRPWRLGAWVADRYHSATGRCFLVGDAAHQFLPAGGFGLNCGLADAHNLAWKLAMVLKDDGFAVDPGLRARLLATYTAERRPVARQYDELSRHNFDKILAVAAAIGLDWEAARWLDWLARLLPLPGVVGRRFFRMAMGLGLRQIDLLKRENILTKIRRRQLERLFGDPEANLALRHPQADLGIVYAKGWMMAGGAVDGRLEDSPDPLTSVVVGARLPHFRLKPAGDGTAAPVSSLELPPLIARRRGRPKHLLLLIDLSLKLGRRLAALRADPFGPLELIRIGSATRDGVTVDYDLDDDGEGFRPERGALLIRPDGIVAWTW